MRKMIDLFKLRSLVHSLHLKLLTSLELMEVTMTYRTCSKLVEAHSLFAQKVYIKNFQEPK